MSLSPLIPVILSGGSGTRLWPFSRKSFPKQYLSFDSENNKTLLQKTRERTLDIKNSLDPILICNEEHRFIVAEQMRQIGTKPLSILLEPIGKNTAPAIALAALKALEIENNPILLILSSDHEIKNKQYFLEAVEKGIEYVEDNKLVTFGIIPTYPETGYGYIKSEKPLTPNKINGEKIVNFIEKPNLSKANEFIVDKRFSWNSGIFMFKAKVILEELCKFKPDIVQYCKSSLKESKKDLEFERIDKNSFSKCTNISIDIAVMEKTKLGIVLPLNSKWSDLGSWKSIWEVSEKDKDGNFSQGNVIIENTKDSYLKSDNRLVVGLGLDNLIIVETKDAVLVADKNHSQKVKDLVSKLKEKNILEGQNHSRVYRPWGYYESLVSNSTWQVKIIVVKPGEKLSLQMHHHRSEHWVVVKGTAEIELNNKKEILKENQSIYIPLGSIHRLINPGKMPLTLIEVQSGSYIGEDDIVRFSDIYGRIE